MYSRNLPTQSLGVRTAAYGCQWYNRSQNLKKLLQIVIMRTKEPVKMTAGRFFVISLETFADVMIHQIIFNSFNSVVNSFSHRTHYITEKPPSVPFSALTF